MKTLTLFLLARVFTYVADDRFKITGAIKGKKKRWRKNQLQTDTGVALRFRITNPYPRLDCEGSFIYVVSVHCSLHAGKLDTSITKTRSVHRSLELTTAKVLVVREANKLLNFFLFSFGDNFFAASCNEIHQSRGLQGRYSSSEPPRTSTDPHQ